MAAGEARAELREQASRFFAFIAPAENVEAAERFVDRLRREYPDATHHCYAWRIGWPPAERAADDGEPSGTAGQPILRALRGAALTDVVAVVVRWFGGTKLGKGGLSRAYSGVVRLALGSLPTRREAPSRELLLELPHDQVGAVKRLLRPPAVVLLAEAYTGEPRLRLRVHLAAEPKLLEKLAGLGIVPADEGD